MPPDSPETPVTPEPPDPTGHVPVLLGPVLQHLSPAPGQSALDCTLGRGGHAAALIPLIPGGRFVGLDTDAENAAFARARLRPIADRHNVHLDVIHTNFAAYLGETGPDPSPDFDLILADLGFASNQMDDPGRGFSFKSDGPLDMRLDPTDDDTPTAADLVNTLPQDQLADLIYEYGEERLSRRIARKIAQTRAEHPIQTTGRLAQIVRPCYPPPRPRKGQRGPIRHRIDPATRTFQALRIAVNGELDALDALLAALPHRLHPGGRAAVISFHSLEDRRVKQAFLKLEQDDIGKRLTRKPETADEAEADANPRSRSAKLRAFEKTR